VGGVSATNIAEWNGSAWSALGSGFGGVSPFVYALAFDSSGNLYAGGYFTSAGGVSANAIARWDGSAWSALGSGIGGYGTVYSLVYDNSGNLYAGGAFNVAGGVPANSIAQWNGSSWSALGSGINAPGSGTIGIVHSLVFDSAANLYVGGNFTTAGTNVSAFVAEALFHPPLPLPQLTMTISGPYVILQWPTNFTGFSVQSTTDALPSGTSWTSVVQPPVINNGQYTVTILDGISAAKKYYRLKQ
jgi:hypothetical protein